MQDFIKDYAANTNNTEKEESFSAIDLTCYNANTGSNVAVSYLLNQKNEKFDQYVDSTIAAILKQSTGINKTYTQTDLFEKTIAGHPCLVYVIEATRNDITIKESVCFFEIDTYVGMITVVPNAFNEKSETFENIIKNFSSVK